MCLNVNKTLTDELKTKPWTYMKVYKIFRLKEGKIISSVIKTPIAKIYRAAKPLPKNKVLGHGRRLHEEVVHAYLNKVNPGIGEVLVECVGCKKDFVTAGIYGHIGFTKLYIGESAGFIDTDVFFRAVPYEEIRKRKTKKTTKKKTVRK